MLTTLLVWLFWLSLSVSYRSGLLVIRFSVQFFVLLYVTYFKDVLLAGVTFEDFMVAIATMTSKDKTFFRSLLSIYMSINSAGN